MDFQRIIAIFGIVFASTTLWAEWQKVNHPQPAPTKVATSAGIPQASSADASVPKASVSTQTQDGVPQVSAPTAVQNTGSYVQKGNRIKVRTNLVDAEIDTLGGDIRYLAFRKHFEHEDSTKTKQLVFFTDKNSTDLYLPQSGLLGGNNLPTHKAQFQLAPDQPAQVTLTEKEKKANIHLIHTTPEGVVIHKIITFLNDQYVIRVAYQIENKSAQPINNLNAYFQLVRHSKPPVGDPALISTFTGMATYTENSKFSKIHFEDITKNKVTLPSESKDGWVAMLQHYFVSAWLPMDGIFKREFYTKKINDHLFSGGMVIPVGSIQPNGNITLTIPLYAGPQDQENLEKIAKGLEYVVDYGILTPIAKPIYWGLSGLYNTVGNWGVAIILLTLFIKLLFFPLSAKSYKSMAQMRALAPKLELIKQRAGDDKMALQRDMIDLYRREKINPLSGCLPLIVQMPIFIALYWVLLSSVEIRQAPMGLWIHDLSIPDPYYILPVIMMVSMFVQVKLNPTPADPIQAKMALILPLVFGITFFFFPAGLVLYWFFNNIIGIAQQWYINYQVDNQKNTPKVTIEK